MEDLNSTNGTQVNGHPVSKHFLQHNDIIQMARYKLVYQVDSEEEIKDNRPRCSRCRGRMPRSPYWMAERR
nr:FHA domain-containing protein [Collimonas arenae]